MLESRNELNLIDGVLQMCGQETCVDVNVDFGGGHDVAIFATISLVKETLRNCEEAPHSITKYIVDVTNERMCTF